MTNPNFTSEVWKGLTGAEMTQARRGRVTHAGDADEPGTAVGPRGQTGGGRWQVLLSRVLRRRRD
jgi:hypothetical protein